MCKKMVFIFISAVLIIGMTSGHAAAYNINMSWNFRIFNNPNARQVAINTAEKQAEMIDVEEEDPLERFRERFERRLTSRIQRDMVSKILDDEELAFGDYEVGDLEISIAEDPDTGEVLVEITDVVTGETTVITYSSDEWPTEYSW